MKLLQIFARIFEFTVPGFLSFSPYQCSPPDCVCGRGEGDDSNVFWILRELENFEKLVPNFPSMNKSLESKLPQISHKFCYIINCSIFS